MPECPDWLLPEAKAEWERLCEKFSDMGVLTEIDMAAFAAYCQSFARWKEAQEHIDEEGSTFATDKGYQQQTTWVGIANTNQKLMLQAAAEFGLTPSARSRIMAASGARDRSVTYENDHEGVAINYETVGRAVRRATKSRACSVVLDEDWADDITEYHEKKHKKS